jgi:hypothetical protein
VPAPNSTPASTAKSGVNCIRVLARLARNYFPRFVSPLNELWRNKPSDVMSRNTPVPLSRVAMMAATSSASVSSSRRRPSWTPCDWYARAEGGRLGGGDDGDLEEHREAPQVAEGIVAGVPVVEVQPERFEHGKGSAELFIGALRRADPARVKVLKDRAVALAQKRPLPDLSRLCKSDASGTMPIQSVGDLPIIYQRSLQSRLAGASPWDQTDAFSQWISPCSNPSAVR